MTNNELDFDHLWEVLSSTSNIINLEYGAQVTIGSVFGQMRGKIEELQKQVETLTMQRDIARQAPLWQCSHCYNLTENPSYSLLKQPTNPYKGKTAHEILKLILGEWPEDMKEEENK